MDIRTLCKPLEDAIYDATMVDWDIEIRHTLTEPVCPMVSIRPEGWNITRYRFDRDTIEEAVALAVARVKCEVIDRQIVGHAAPFTDEDDAAFEKWLQKRVAGSDAELPESPSSVRLRNGS